MQDIRYFVFSSTTLKSSIVESVPKLAWSFAFSAKRSSIFLLTLPQVL